MRNHYDALNTTPSADDAAIKKAYRKFALTHHPDKTLHLPDNERRKREHDFKLASNAYEVLSDKGKRAAYDRDLRSSRLNAAPPQQQQAKQKRPSQKAYTKPPPPPKPQAKPQAPEPEYAGDYAQQRREKEKRKYAQPGPQWQWTPPPQAPHPPPPQWTSPPPPRPFQVSDFSAGSPQATFTGRVWFFHAPVAESDGRTTVGFTNHQGWDFSISVCKRYKLVQRPVLPPVDADTRGEMMICLKLVRDQSVVAKLFTKEVVLDVRQTPGARETALSSMLVEKPDGIELRITLATSQAAPAKSPAWIWAFDANLAHMVGFMRVCRVSHLMFWPQYPAHAVLERGEMPGEPYPAGTPMAAMALEWPGIAIRNMNRGEYCKEETWAGKKLWRLAAVGNS
jgi:hypothetical protein